MFFAFFRLHIDAPLWEQYGNVFFMAKTFFYEPPAFDEALPHLVNKNISFAKNIYDFFRKRKINLWIAFFITIYVISIIKFITLQQIENTTLLSIYSIIVSLYVLSRFALAYFYEIEPTQFDKKYKPTISFGVPAKNEGGVIRETLLRMIKSDYPKKKFDIIAVNDGSTDDTLEEMLKAKKIAEKEGVVMKVIDWKINKGKRDGMAECVRQSKNEIIIFIDSDSFVKKNTAKELVKFFSYADIAAVAGHAYVANMRKNLLTKMQAVRYYIAFKANKAAEALFGSVTCCSGCCSAYRRSYVLEVVDAWANETFLGVKCTFGDDRSLTNSLLKRGYKTLFAPKAIVRTFVPDTVKKFLTQQLRWKKSWLRESLKASFFMWKKNPMMSVSFYLGFILPIISPIIVARALLWMPVMTRDLPYSYILGLLLITTVYGLFYQINTNDKKWVYGMALSLFFSIILIWQLPWAILNLRDSRWGTR